LPPVAPSFSSTLVATSVNDSTLHASPLPLAQYTGLKISETSTGDVRVLKDDSRSCSKELRLFGPHLEDAFFVEFCGDVVMGSDTPSIKHIDPICNEPLDLTLASSPLLPTTPSHLHAFHESLGDIRSYNPSFVSYCAYLEDVPRKIIWSTFFDNTFDFSMAFSKFRRPLTFLASSFVVLSYLYHSEMHVVTYDKHLGALTASEWSDLSLNARSG